VAVRWVRAHIFSPAPYQISDEEGKVLQAGTRFQIDVHGKAVCGWRWGEGPSVLFVHGWNGRGIQFYRYFESLRRAGYAIIAFDAPGHGESEGNTSSYFELTDTIRAFIHPQRGFDIKGIIGHSLGGSAVINALAKEKMTLPVALIAPAFRLKDVLFNTFQLYGIPKPVYEEAIAQFERRFGYSLEKDDPWKLMPELNAAIFVVHDRQDQTIPFHDSKEMAQAWPHMDLCETNGLGHRRIVADRNVKLYITDYIIQCLALTDMPQPRYAYQPNAVRQVG
jgi:pimeloyl-ACP methyl ester carboxylesterase